MSKNIRIDLQNDLRLPTVPDIGLLKRWVQAALQQDYDSLEQTIRVVDEAESRQLNHSYRGKDSSTNVLSFVAEDCEYLDYAVLGDLVICAPVVEREAQAQHKTAEAHWAHMVVHGMLHLQGLDHIEESQARQMENLEIGILSRLGFENPYSSR